VAIETAATLLERERELREVSDALTAAQRGRGKLVLVEAAAGLGKTSLLAAATETATRLGFTCLRARATELERDFAYGLVRQLLEAVIATASDPERDRLFEGAATLSAPLFAPTGAAQPASSADSEFSILHGLYWLLNNIADECPVALVVDDLHWSDTESLRFFNYLAPRLDGLPVGILASARSGEDVPAELARLTAAPEATVLRPGPLSTGATATLCKRRLGDDVAPEFVSACREATGGNPFFLEALLREASERELSPDAREADRVREIGPAAVAEAVLLRLSEAPEAATGLVRAVAVLGDGASLAEAARLAGLGEEDAVHAADLLAAVAILDPGESLEFTHPIVREAVYEEIGSRERAQAHARAAGILAESDSSEERIAAQIVEAEPAGDPDRVDLLRRVAAEALARGAPAAAAALLRRALAEPPPMASRGEVLVELSSAELRLGTPEAAIDQLMAATELIREPHRLTMAARLLGGALTWSGNADRAVEAIGSAIERVESEDRELTLLLEADRAGYAQQARLDTRAPVVAQLERYGELDGATPGERLVLASLAFERARASESETEAVDFIKRALADGRLLGEQAIDVAGTHYLLLLGLLATDALDLADSCAERMLADARTRASIPAQAFVMVHRGWGSLRRGAVASAEADARTTLELLTTYDISLGTRFALALLVGVLIESGELEAAERALRSSGLGDEIPPGMANNDLLEARGLLNVAQGRMREGLDDLLEFGRRDELWGAANPLASRWRSRASLALAAIGDGEGARVMIADDLERARRWGAASGIGVALRSTGLVERGDASVDRLREAAEVLERSPARLECARALTDLGAALRRANRRSEARGPLRQGLDLAQRCGARALVERARTELRAAGGRSSDPYATGVEQLTATERRVAEHAAKGLSNPQIAQALFVTRKTVETHLGHAYRKLDISGRQELARALGDQVPDAAG
jgi:DNA-binding CsgD family transcriptional regulator